MKLSCCPSRWFSLLLVLCLVQSLPAIRIQLDYTYDTSDFFDDPEARAALEAAARFFEAVLDDSLLELNAATFDGSDSWTARFTDPSTGEFIDIPNLVVPEDTLVVFAGARPFGDGPLGIGGPGGFGASGTQAWLDRVVARGKPGALETPRTDFGPWGGSIFFNEDANWHFQLDGRPTGSQANFVSVALHELGHLLGVGTAGSWNAQITVLDDKPHFIGAESMLSYGGPVPLAGDQSHWDFKCCALGIDPDNVNSRTFVSFGRPHGLLQSAIMDPVSCTITSSTTLDVFTDLDLAGLQDIGWRLRAAGSLEPVDLAPGNVTVTWPSTTGLEYTVQRSIDLAGWTDLFDPDAGDGTLAEFTDAAAPPDHAFYRLLIERPGEALAMAGGDEAEAAPEPTGEIMTITQEPRIVDSCGHGCCGQVTP